MTARFILAQHFLDLRLEDVVVVAPDVGRAKLAQKFAEKIGADLAVLTKERPAQQVAEIGYVIGVVAGKTAVIIDDIIDTAGTLCAAAETLLEHGREERLRRRDPRRLLGQRVRKPRAHPFERIVVTDTIPLRAGAPDNVFVLPVRGAAHRLDPPDLHRRLGERGLRRREPALLNADVLHRVAVRLELSDEETLAIFELDALSAISGESGHRPRSRSSTRSPRRRPSASVSRCSRAGCARARRAGVRSTCCSRATSPPSRTRSPGASARWAA